MEIKIGFSALAARIGVFALKVSYRSHKHAPRATHGVYTDVVDLSLIVSVNSLVA